MEKPPILQAPGAGLPFFERSINRLFGRALIRRLHTWESAIDQTEAAARQLMERFEAVPLADRETPILIKRLPNMEDSSRYWSAAMVLEHLNITGEIFEHMVVGLSQGKTIHSTKGTADVKPTGAPAAGVAAKFEHLHLGLRERLASACGPQRKAGTHTHPWFGAMSASDWLGLIPLHMRLHEKQLQAIVRGLEARPS